MKQSGQQRAGIISDPRESIAPDQGDAWRVFKIMAEFVEGFEVLGDLGQAVSIFGSARTKPDHPEYQQAVDLAAEFARRGTAVITGGGPGIMEAGNKGAFEAGGVSVGLNIKLPFEQTGNPYQTIGLDFNYFYARKVCFVKYSNGFVCCPGGFGTLDEFFETVTLIQTLKSDPFPVVLLGTDYWGGLVDWIGKTLPGAYASRADTDIFRLTDSVEEAADWVCGGNWWTPSAHTKLAPEAERPTGEGTRSGTKIKEANGHASEERPQS